MCRLNAAADAAAEAAAEELFEMEIMEDHLDDVEEGEEGLSEQSSSASARVDPVEAVRPKPPGGMETIPVAEPAAAAKVIGFDLRTGSGGSAASGGSEAGGAGNPLVLSLCFDWSTRMWSYLWFVGVFVLKTGSGWSR